MLTPGTGWHLNDERVQLLDKWSHSLVIYSYPEMTFLRTIGGQGGAPGKFNSPQGLDIDDETGNIFVADTGNDRVQVGGDFGNGKALLARTIKFLSPTDSDQERSLPTLHWRENGER